MVTVRFIKSANKQSMRLPKYGIDGDWVRGESREMDGDNAKILIAKYPDFFVIENAVVTSAPVDRAVKTAPKKRAPAKPKAKAKAKPTAKGKTK